MNLEQYKKARLMELNVEKDKLNKLSLMSFNYYSN